MNLRKSILSFGTVSISFLAFSEVSLARTYDTEVPANQCWFDSGVYLREGASFSVSASGTWSNGGAKPQNVDPNGFNDYYLGSAISPDAPFASLIGRIGIEGIPFFIGNSSAYVSGNSGQLYLSMNDTPGTCDDNYGSLDVEIDIR